MRVRYIGTKSWRFRFDRIDFSSLPLHRAIQRRTVDIPLRLDVRLFFSNPTSLLIDTICLPTRQKRIGMHLKIFGIKHALHFTTRVAPITSPVLLAIPKPSTL